MFHTNLILLLIFSINIGHSRKNDITKQIFTESCELSIPFTGKVSLNLLLNDLKCENDTQVTHVILSGQNSAVKTELKIRDEDFMGLNTSNRVKIDINHVTRVKLKIKACMYTFQRKIFYW